MAYICIYVDIVIAQPNAGPNGNRKMVLIAIAIYSSVQMAIKLILAIFHHIRFHIVCCQAPIATKRRTKVNAYWEASNR